MVRIRLGSKVKVQGSRYKVQGSRVKGSKGFITVFWITVFWEGVCGF
jgi:hypothetical protein